MGYLGHIQQDECGRTLPSFVRILYSTVEGGILLFKGNYFALFYGEHLLYGNILLSHNGR
jgi:hypothetical protein